MKRFIVALLLVASASATAGNITLINTGEEISGDSKYCFYSNSNYEDTYKVSKNRQCPYTRTFSTDEDDE